MRRLGVLVVIAASLFGCRAGPKPAERAMGGAGGDGLPAILFADGGRLMRLRDDARAGPRYGRGAGNPALIRLRALAESAMSVGPFTVTKKEILPDSNDRNDYMSLGRYWWPNPDTSDGLPYVWRDGEVNPEIYSVADKQELAQMLAAVTTLSHAYFVFGNREYAERAAHLLRVWFVEPATKMNPNMEFAQIHRGHKEVRGSGLIDGRDLGMAVSAFELIAPSRVFSQYDEQQFRSWVSRYLEWLQTSARGKDERDAENNHGTYFLNQLVALAAFTGETGVLREILEKEAPKLMDRQLESDGSQPRELKRTKPFSYSVFNLIAWARFATLAQRLGVDLWHHETPDGATLKTAFEYLMPCLAEEKACPIDPSKVTRDRARDLAPGLAMAADVFGEPRWREVAQSLVGDPSELEVLLAVPPGTK